ncbi:MAG: hypothetical protein JSR91_12970 [Proteobacteria bacterium]|nr:hypothetical protein [Pseudomonadota bacterium]
MTDFSSRGAAVETSLRTGDGWAATPTKLARDERIWTWLLRLVLPVVLGLCVQLITWIWFNNIYDLDAWSIAGGTLLAFVVLPVAVWTWHSWLPLDREIPAMPTARRLQLRHVVLVLLACAMVAGYASLNTSRDDPHGSTTLSSNA